MADKVQLIKEEIERRIENLKISLDKNCVTEESKLDIRGNITTLYGLLDFIDSLPEEPKKQPKFKVGDTIKGPCNNIFQVKEVLDKQYVLHSENGDELNSIEIVDKYSCISEKPASEDLEEASINYADNEEYGDDVYYAIKAAFKAAAEWQKQKDFEELLKSDMTQFKKFYEKGLFDMREEMMRDVVETTIVNDWQYGKDPDHAIIPAIHQRIDGFNVGDKVKIIIVKPE